MELFTPTFDDKVFERKQGGLAESVVDLLGDSDVDQGDWEGCFLREGERVSQSDSLFGVLVVTKEQDSGRYHRLCRES